MPVEQWRQLGAVGTVDDAAAYIEAVCEAGADAVALFPSPMSPLEDAAMLAEHLLPRFA